MIAARSVHHPASVTYYFPLGSSNRKFRLLCVMAKHNTDSEAMLISLCEVRVIYIQLACRDIKQRESDSKIIRINREYDSCTYKRVSIYSGLFNITLNCTQFASIRHRLRASCEQQPTDSSKSGSGDLSQLDSRDRCAHDMHECQHERRKQPRAIDKSHVIAIVVGAIQYYTQRRCIWQKYGEYPRVSALVLRSDTSFSLDWTHM